MFSLFKKGIKIDLAGSLGPVISELQPLIEKEFKKKYKKGITDGLLIGAVVGFTLGALAVAYGGSPSKTVNI